MNWWWKRSHARIPLLVDIVICVLVPSLEQPMQLRNTQLRQFPADISCCKSFHIFERLNV
ncbi:hypothetical protein T07_5643 [Trichinella nelsoni]|uniref:Uncharacterized protein n=1 Tax=Trichinella nelsoni TaxID=6336 RepID=A0A0V0SJ43_9BILA|nr:hypothetical protein T07_5643 [Trichinella nelsoni]